MAFTTTGARSEARRTIRFLNWLDYVAPAVYTGFEKETGIHVDVSSFGNAEESITRVAFGESFDVVMAIDYAASRLRTQGLLRPLEMDRLTNWRHVTSPRLKKPAHDPETDGRKYTSVNFFGSEGFAVRVDKVPRFKTSWELLYNADLDGRIDMLNGAREVLGPALYLLGGNPNTTDATLLDRAAEMAIAQRPLVRMYDSDYTSNRIVEGTPVVHCWDGDAWWAIKEGVRQVRYVTPQEGFSLWLDAPCIPSSTTDPEGAHLFIDYLLRPEVAAENSAYQGYFSAVDAAAALIKNPVQRSLRPTDVEIEQGTFREDLGTANALYDAAYRRVQAA